MKSMKKPKENENPIHNAHIDEQIEACGKNFLQMLEHYGVKGCLYVQTPDKAESLYLFSTDRSKKALNSILRKNLSLSRKGLGDSLDKTI